MSDSSFERHEQVIREKASALPYPPTPDIANRVQRRSTKAISPTGRLIKAAVVVTLAIAIGLAAVPQVRAAITDILRLGAVRIFLSPPTGTSVSTVSATSVAPIVDNLNLANSISPTEAIKTAPFPLKSPTHPPDLGQPDAILVEHLGEPVYVMVWMSSDVPDTPYLLLYQMGSAASNGLFLGKLRPPIVTTIEVNGQSAFWTTGPYIIQFFQQGQAIPGTERNVASHGLIWEVDGVTYRLEGDFSREKAVQIAESLQPFTEK